MLCWRNLMAKNGTHTRRFFATVQENKLEYYRNLNETQSSNARPQGWEEAIPFDKIPGPKPWPLVGNAWRFIPKIGTYSGLNMLEVLEKLHEDFGDVVALRNIPGRGSYIHLYNPEDIEIMFRNEGPWPVRHGLPSLAYYRSEVRKNEIKNAGLLAKQGEEWFQFRTVVNPILMQPRNVLQYAKSMDLVANQLVDNIQYLSTLNEHGEMPVDFQNELYKWALESICVVTTDTHLGCLNRDQEPNSEGQKLITYVLEMFQLMYKLDYLPSLWKYYSTRTWKRYVQVLDFITETNLKYINQVLDKALETTDEDSNVLQKLLKKDKDLAISMTVDLLMAGIDTTGRILAVALYYIARNPDKQQQLRQEAIRLLPEKNSPITKEVLAKADYLRAVIKETTRLSPIAVGNLRTTVRDLVLGGYQIPKGSEVLSCNLVLATKDQHYTRAKAFIPERFLAETTGELSHRNTNPFVTAPFGHGPRSCIGKRLANLELNVALLRIVRNFELQWTHEDMTFDTGILHGIAKPLQIRVKPFNG